MKQFTPSPPRIAPIKQTGAWVWIRENLFASPTQILLTAVVLLIIASVMPDVFNWVFFNATWLGTTKADCVGSAGACWIFIKERSVQILAGTFYSQNPDELWRPLLALALLIGLVVPLLVEGVKHKWVYAVLLFAVYPFIAFGLLHGEWFGLLISETHSWGGFLLTFVLAVAGIVLALPIGILFALGRRSELRIIRTFSVFYIEFWRGSPLITILFMASVMLPLFLPSGSDIDKLLRALIGITLFQSAYTAEAVRSGLAAVEKGQFEASDTLGLNYVQKMVFIVLPQALAISIPSIVNTFISLFKDTSLVAIIGLFDLLGIAHAVSRSSEWRGLELEAYVFAALIYWVFCYGMSRYSQNIEAKLQAHKNK